MKSYTDLEQSKKLAEILPLESADCYWDYDEMQKFHRISWFEDGYNKESQLRFNENNICAWSLAALLDVLESEIDGEDGETYQLNIEKDGNWWNVWYREQYDEANPIETESTEDLVDVCYEMIVKLKEQKLL